jgi:hypothetical protein
MYKFSIFSLHIQHFTHVDCACPVPVAPLNWVHRDRDGQIFIGIDAFISGLPTTPLSTIK